MVTGGYVFINKHLLSIAINFGVSASSCIHSAVYSAFRWSIYLKRPKKPNSYYYQIKVRLSIEKNIKYYLKWLEIKNITPGDANQTVFLAYFQEMSETYSPNTLWTKWSMLKSMVTIQEKRDITKLNELEAFLKRKSKNYKPKKVRCITPQKDVFRFLKEAPDEIHLLHKVVLIMGYFGGCRTQELLNMKIVDIEDRHSVIVVNVPESKTGALKKFTVVDDKEFSALPLLRRYTYILAPCRYRKIFLSFRPNRCISQPIGKNMFGKIPSKIAVYLGLPNPSSYTGHCLRCTSATALADAGASSRTNLKRHGGWKSSTVAEGYLEESIALKK
ncbi:hypothetical protein NQ315_003586 [Exocentrus adspersus]|uniref:Tyr recombinase domain-containing protein n=1 Tax=Exocentrus adspersus TaxID=1586481 RepID=A0AAV8VJ05_9CUCU|nr:hypothetical protein NQ315_003586 [Exocentrus adspersus]